MPSWELMWALTIVIYAGCKLATWSDARLRQAPAWKQGAYLLGWPGMDAASFLGNVPISERSTCTSNEWLAAAVKAALGAALLFGVARMIPPNLEYLAGWVGMIGLVLILHFGVFSLALLFLAKCRRGSAAPDESSS